jgi:cytochrome c oxidase cbb3-type subunit 1
VRLGAGVLFLSGALVMVYNMWRTARGDIRTETNLGAVAPATA